MKRLHTSVRKVRDCMTACTFISVQIKTAEDMKAEDPKHFLIPEEGAQRKPRCTNIDAPALHVQAVDSKLPIGERAFGSHAVQVDKVDAPLAVEYVSAGQRVHAALPEVVLYAPAGQATHACNITQIIHTFHLHERHHKRHTVSQTYLLA